MRRYRPLRFIRVLSVLWLTGRLGAAQAQADPSFEVASVKPVKREIPLQKPLNCTFPARGRFSGFGDLRWLIACAYGISPARARQEIVGAPRWVDDELFEIQAKASDDDTPAFTVSQGLLMVRAVLADRFMLAAHRESRELPAYALVTARRDGRLGSQLRPTPGNCAAWIAGGRRGAPPPLPGDLPCGRQVVSAFAFRGTAMTLSQLVNLLSSRVERPVQDRTGLEGTFALDLQWRPEEAPPNVSLPDGLPTSIFTALREQLGLRLESTKTAIDLLVIDHVEHPTAN